MRRHPPRYRLEWSPGRFQRSASLNLTGSTPRASSASLAVLAASQGVLHSHCKFASSVLPPCDRGTMWSHSSSSVTRPQDWQVYWSLRLTASTSRLHGRPPLPLPQRMTGSGWPLPPFALSPITASLCSPEAEAWRLGQVALHRLQGRCSRGTRRPAVPARQRSVSAPLPMGYP